MYVTTVAVAIANYTKVLSIYVVAVFIRWLF